VRAYEETNEPYDSYNIYRSLKIYEVPDRLTGDEEKVIYNGEVGKAVEISHDIMRRFPNTPTSDDESGIRLVLDEDQQNYVIGRLIKGEGYPASAIDKVEWELYHTA
jgi:hypothetical protein